MTYPVFNWARKQPVSRSSDKFLLVMMADQANEEGVCWPSQKGLAEDTSLDRKTVGAGLTRLREEGHIVDTGERKGATKQVVVWRLPYRETSPKTDKLSENGSVPFFPPKDTVFPVEAPRFSRVRTPKTGYGTTIEPPKEPPEEPPGERGSKTAPAPDLLASLAPPKLAKAPRVKPRTSVDPTWWPDLGGLAFAAERHVDPKTVVPQFRDWHLAKGSLMANWEAAWRTWCENQVRFAAERGTRSTNGYAKAAKPTGADNVRAMWDYVTNGPNAPPDDHPADMTIDLEVEDYHEA